MIKVEVKIPDPTITPEGLPRECEPELIVHHFRRLQSIGDKREMENFYRRNSRVLSDYGVQPYEAGIGSRGYRM